MRERLRFASATLLVVIAALAVPNPSAASPDYGTLVEDATGDWTGEVTLTGRMVEERTFPIAPRQTISIFWNQTKGYGIVHWNYTFPSGVHLLPLPEGPLSEPCTPIGPGNTTAERPSYARCGHIRGASPTELTVGWKQVMLDENSTVTYHVFTSAATLYEGPPAFVPGSLDYDSDGDDDALVFRVVTYDGYAEELRLEYSINDGVWTDDLLSVQRVPLSMATFTLSVVGFPNGALLRARAIDGFGEYSWTFNFLIQRNEPTAYSLPAQVSQAAAVAIFVGVVSVALVAYAIRRRRKARAARTNGSTKPGEKQEVA